ncbi:UDP-N-acetylglucosamine 1-carboxyvinyltransferase [Helicobacter ailurogastricus]|uniref:UDP-N-acetylglucosamine 1-carboxyvinyltransferase n=1 Tax=Helicobacter ailurogastricus TaxID=1578720 RepID=UPI0022C7BA0E|nr:UDP-N-acetylglucosamine 1-carboxyvinyltransferase [Helicobacter ailurogastricus]GLH58724.1 UDP-N-acetylglucosamine 1-carboxyvinyltransferase MurA [Helicobacter ailurogastricus]GLH60252.1 UDP-N-acetylglucosamine 1-carboxyvinyltransferase MurA [Helicobacter ailurogastricus]
MDYLEIKGGQTLNGQVAISGAKNAALPLLASTLLAKEQVRLNNLPHVADVRALVELLEHLGAQAKWHTPNTLEINTSQTTQCIAPYEIVRKMRASILVLGPLLGRFGKCQVSLPGGCAIGARPVDLHLSALEKMGAEIAIDKGYIVAKAKKGLKGCDLIFDKITVTGTENILMAASLAKGQTRIINAAKEPEVAQLCAFLQAGGVQISGVGSGEILVQGTDRQALDLKEINIIPDRIECGTYLCAAAITNSPLTLTNTNAHHLEAVLTKLGEIGFRTDIVEETPTNHTLKIHSTQQRKAFSLTTTEYPGFPTDLQAQFMALATQCEGSSLIEERLFENRFMHVGELQRMGAQISLKGAMAQIQGASDLTGADVMATDLRASSALVLAALVAKGKTRLHRIYHLDRGYEALENKMNALGAHIKRLHEKA